MTTIAYRDGVMAADSGCWVGDASHGWAVKLAKGPDGVLYDAAYFAIGAGAPAALGAMFAGATASVAIEAAKEHGSGAFGKVRTIWHEPEEEKK